MWIDCYRDVSMITCYETSNPFQVYDIFGAEKPWINVIFGSSNEEYRSTAVNAMLNERNF